MRDFVIYLDSTCDMTAALLNKYGIKYMVMGLSVDDKEYPASLLWEDFTPAEYYAIMRKGTRVFTVQVNEPAFVEAWEQELKEGKDILYIGCSGKLSATVRNGAKVAKDLMEKYEGSKIVVIDPLTSGMAQGILGLEAAEMKENGKSIDEIAEYIEANKLHYQQWAAVGSLTYLKNAGRVKASAAFFGNLFGIKPIVISDANGNNAAFKKIRGRQPSLEEIVKLAVECAEDVGNHYIAITHADCEKEALWVKEQLERQLQPKGFLIQELGPILGTSCGPETIIINMYGKEVTFVGE